MHIELTFKLLKNSLNPDINSTEKGVDPDQLKKPADEDPHCVPQRELARKKILD